MDQLKAAVIGCGDHAQSHFSMIADEPRLHLAVIAEMDAERLQRAKTKQRPDYVFDDCQQMIEVRVTPNLYVVNAPELDCMVMCRTQPSTR